MIKKKKSIYLSQNIKGLTMLMNPQRIIFPLSAGWSLLVPWLFVSVLTVFLQTLLVATDGTS